MSHFYACPVCADEKRFFLSSEILSHRSPLEDWKKDRWPFTCTQHPAAGTFAREVHATTGIVDHVEAHHPNQVIHRRETIAKGKADFLVLMTA